MTTPAHFKGGRLGNSQNRILKMNTPTTYFVTLLASLLTSCSVVPDDRSELTGLAQLEAWKVEAKKAKAMGASENAYAEAQLSVNTLIEEKVLKEIDNVASSSLFGIGPAVDLKKENLITSETKGKVNSYLNSTTRFGSSGIDTAALAKLLYDWGKKAAEDRRQESAENLKDRVKEKSIWPDWSELD